MAYTTINKSSDYFNTKLYTGNGTARSITGVGFQPDWSWFKSRGDTNSHALYDAVRGVTKAISSNSTGAEATESQGLTSFDSDGFSIGSQTAVNASGHGIVSWNWKANGAGSSNTDGSITSTVSANTTSGFSIVSYTGTGSSATIGHGLGVAPKFTIIKKTSGTGDWSVQSSVIGLSNYLVLNSTNASAGTSGALISAVSSTTLTVDGNSDVNGSGSTYVAYCFAEKTGYSKFGSYVGNGSSDGSFCYLGFKPAVLLLKQSSGTSASTEYWTIWDNKRDIDNPVGKRLYPNLSNAESTGTDLDILSNGFKIRSSGGNQNTSGGTYIYMAIAEAPLVGTNNVPCTAR